MSKTWAVQWIQAGESVNANLTRFAMLGANSTFELGNTEANVDRPLRDAGTFRNLIVRVSAITMVDSSPFHLRSGGTNSALTVTIGIATGDYEDLSNSVAVTAGTLINWQIVTGVIGTSLAISLVSVEFETTTNCATIFAADAASSSNLNVASTQTFFGAMGQRIGNATEASADFRVKTGGVWSDLLVQVGTCTRTTDVAIRSRIEAADGNQTITATGGDDNVMYEDTSNSDTIVADNDIDVSITTGTGTGNWNVEKLAGTFITTTQEFLLAVNGSPERINAGLTRFWAIGGSMQNGEEATEANVAVDAPFAFTASDLTVDCTASTGLIDSTIRSRISGANGNQVVTFDDGATGIVTDAANTDVISAGAPVNTSVVTVNGTNVDFGFVSMLGITAAAATDTFARAIYPNIGQRRIMMPSGGSRF